MLTFWIWYLYNLHLLYIIGFSLFLFSYLYIISNKPITCSFMKQLDVSKSDIVYVLGNHTSFFFLFFLISFFVSNYEVVSIEISLISFWESFLKIFCRCFERKSQGYRCYLMVSTAHVLLSTLLKLFEVLVAELVNFKMFPSSYNSVSVRTFFRVSNHFHNFLIRDINNLC